MRVQRMFLLTLVTKLWDSVWVSLGLFCLTYGVFGWLFGEFIPSIQQWILQHYNYLQVTIGDNYVIFPWRMTEAIAYQLSWGFGGFLVMLIMVVLAAPSRIIRLCFGSWLRSDIKAFMLVLAWAFAAVIIIRWLRAFSRFFVLLSAGMLFHFDLILKGFRDWQVFIVLSAVSLGSYILGGYLYVIWGYHG